MSKRDVSSFLKWKNQENNQKCQKTFGFQPKKEKQLLYVTHQKKNPYTRLYYYVISMFSRKKTQPGNGNHWLCTTRKKHPNPWIESTQELSKNAKKPLLYFCLSMSLSLQKKIPSCTLTKKKWMNSFLSCTLGT